MLMASTLITVMILLWTFLTGVKSQSCGPRVSARLLAEIPCDMNKYNYCTSPGTAYPWHAVKRYIYDNQGLVRRMYGDERHSLILSNEITARRLRYDVSWSARSGSQRSIADLRPRARPSSVSKTPPSLWAKETFDNNVTAVPEGNFTNSSSPNTETITADLLTTTDTTSFTTSTTTNAFTEEAFLRSDDVIEENTIHMNTVDTNTEEPVENQEEPPLERGVNACPVKEEFVAPYWANNTRGETLALLNVYPFQQYVNWEICAFEGEQMLCRKGCKCEQQYRLHRLLAFDPKNECRGVFSDWFRFPSCCVCICYLGRNHGYGDDDDST